MQYEVIFGPPGTGKTSTLLKIVEETLASGVDPWRIAYLSFTKKAAEEAMSRAMEKFAIDKKKFTYFRTIHSLCFSRMGINSAEVFDGKKINEFGNWIGAEVTGKINFEEGSTFGNKPGDRALFMANLARIRRVPLREIYLQDSDDLSWEYVDRIARGLLAYKRHHFLIDYTDMLERLVESNTEFDLDTVIVDEAQDLSPIQWAVIERVAARARRVVVAGDDDQAIYRWAGAESGHMGLLRGSRRVLEQSYRVPTSIQAFSQTLVGRIKQRVNKHWLAKADPGVISRVAKYSQADWSSDDILVLARNTSYLSDIQSYLRQQGIPYTYRGTPAISPEVMAAIETWENLRSGHAVDADTVRRMYRYMTVDRGHKTLPLLRGDVTLDMLHAQGGISTSAIWHEALDKLPQADKMYVLTARRQGEKLKKEPRVRLSTIHGSKGGQADHVILVTDMAPRTFKEFMKNADDEYRVWYVAMTRSMRQLTLVDPSSSTFFSL